MPISNIAAHGPDRPRLHVLLPQLEPQRDAPLQIMEEAVHGNLTDFGFGIDTSDNKQQQESQYLYKGTGADQFHAVCHHGTSSLLHRRASLLFCHCKDGSNVLIADTTAWIYGRFVGEIDVAGHDNGITLFQGFAGNGIFRRVFQSCLNVVPNCFAINYGKNDLFTGVVNIYTFTSL